MWDNILDTFSLVGVKMPGVSRKLRAIHIFDNKEAAPKTGALSALCYVRVVFNYDEF